MISVRDVYIRERAGGAILRHDFIGRTCVRPFWAYEDSVGFIYSCSNFVNDSHIRLSGISNVDSPACDVTALRRNALRLSHCWLTRVLPYNTRDPDFTSFGSLLSSTYHVIRSRGCQEISITAIRRLKYSSSRPSLRFMRSSSHVSCSRWLSVSIS